MWGSGAALIKADLTLPQAGKLHDAIGDKAVSDDVGLGKLLSSRCAYLIGTSHQERADVLRDFQEVYRVRSQIIHAGKHRLDSAEHGLLNKLRWMGRRVIQEEVRLLAADLGKA